MFPIAPWPAASALAAFRGTPRPPLALQLRTGGQSTGSAEEALALPPSRRLTLHLLRTQHQVDKADEIHLEVGASIADKHQLTDVTTEHDSCREDRLPRGC